MAPAREPRRDSRRGLLVDLLTDGATIEQCQKFTEWDRTTVWKAIGLIATQLGHEINEDEDGILTCRRPN